MLKGKATRKKRKRAVRLVDCCALWRVYTGVLPWTPSMQPKKIHGPGSAYAGLAVVVILRVCLSVRSAS